MGIVPSLLTLTGTRAALSNCQFGFHSDMANRYLVPNLDESSAVLVTTLLTF